MQYAVPNTVKKRQPIKEKLNRRKSLSDLIFMTAFTIKHFGECLKKMIINTNAHLRAILYITH